MTHIGNLSDKRLSFERNKYGHIVVPIIGLDLFGAQEIARLKAAKYNIHRDAEFCLMSKGTDSYDAHRLVAGREYRIALMPGNEIEYFTRTGGNLRKRGMKQYGYGKPLAGTIPRLRETVSDQQLKEMDALYIAALHDPIANFEGDASVLCVSRRTDRLVDTDFGGSDNLWEEYGLFAFPVATS